MTDTYTVWLTCKAKTNSPEEAEALFRRMLNPLNAHMGIEVVSTSMRTETRQFPNKPQEVEMIESDGEWEDEWDDEDEVWE